MVDEKALKDTIVTTGKELIAFIVLAVHTGHISPLNLKLLSVKYKINKENRVVDLSPEQIQPFVIDVKTIIKKSYRFLMSRYSNHEHALKFVNELISDSEISPIEYHQVLYRYKAKSIAGLQVGQIRPFIKDLEIFIKNKNK